MNKKYSTFVESIDMLAEGREVELCIRDLTPGPRKYDARIVVAIVSSSPDRLPDADVLEVRSPTGFRYPKPWAIKIIEERGDFYPGRPYYSDVSMGLWKK
jgi:hypothetical protein